MELLLALVAGVIIIVLANVLPAGAGVARGSHVRAHRRARPAQPAERPRAVGKIQHARMRYAINRMRSVINELDAYAISVKLHLEGEV
ncbi:MAG: hypothetical protein ACK5IN_01680 [Microbacterium sp.]